MSKHTPGPWTFSQSTQYGDIRFYVAQTDGAPYTPNFSDVASLIAETVSSERRTIQEANARLIAAAPDLLEAVKHCIDWLNAVGIDEDLPVQQQARAAIAKAIGEH